MVATISRLSSAAGAATYYSAAGEYYAEGGLAPAGTLRLAHLSRSQRLL